MESLMKVDENRWDGITGSWRWSVDCGLSRGTNEGRGMKAVII